MTNGAYYSEIDPFAAAWLRELIKEGLIADGEVDTRSIEDITPSDLNGFTQCHFFAGIGVWSHSLRLAGWPDSRPVWTGSCPCQPFSAAGKGGGFADERHLWPALHHLIRIHRPVVVFGEQVASKDGLAWIDLVQADLEGEGYACGAVDSCAAGFGAPHIRQRMYWVADAESIGRTKGKQILRGGVEGIREGRADGCSRDGATRGLADSIGVGRKGILGESDFGMDRGHDKERSQPGPGLGVKTLRLADAKRDGGRTDQPERRQEGRTFDGRNSSRICGDGSARPTNGHWRDADWLLCRDGKWRPVKPGTFPLAHGITNRVGQLRGAGNAIVAWQAQAFIEAYLSLHQ